MAYYHIPLKLLSNKLSYFMSLSNAKNPPVWQPLCLCVLPTNTHFSPTQTRAHTAYEYTYADRNLHTFRPIRVRLCLHVSPAVSVSVCPCVRVAIPSILTLLQSRGSTSPISPVAYLSTYLHVFWFIFCTNR